MLSVIFKNTAIEYIYFRYIQVINIYFLTDNGCLASGDGSKDWLLKNYGKFSSMALLEDLFKIRKDFMAVREEIVIHTNDLVQ